MRIFHKNTPLPRPCGLVARISFPLLLNQHSLVGIRPVKMGLGKIPLGRFIKGSIRPRRTGEESSHWRKEQAQKLEGNGIDGGRQAGVRGKVSESDVRARTATGQPLIPHWQAIKI